LFISSIKHKSSYRSLIGYLKPYRFPFAVALVAMIIFGATDGGIPILIKYILDGVFSKHDQDLLLALPIALIAFSIFRALCDFAQQYYLAKVGHLIVGDMRLKLQQHLITLPPSFFVRNSSADLVTRISSDVMLIRSLVTESLAALIRDTVRIIALLVTAFFLDPFLALIAFVAFPLGIYPIFRFGKRLRKLGRIGQEGVGKISQLLQESILGNRVVKSFSKEQHEIERFKSANYELTKTLIKSEKIRALTGPINEILASIAISGIILYGGFSVMSGVRSQGDFIAFLVSVFLLYDPFKKLTRLANTIQLGMAGFDRINQVLSLTSEIKESEKPLALPSSHQIKFDQVTYRYPDGVQAINNISFTVSPGERVALVGFSGSGKSTIIDLLLRFIDPTLGVVTLGGVDLRQLSIADLRGCFALVGQNTFLFDATIAENIAYGDTNASLDKIIEAAKAAYADEFISTLPDGYNTKVGEAGLALSGGERQRISIARAILKAAPILLLDEATAALDNRAEREVQRALDSLSTGRTTIVIAHRLSSIQNADKIIVLSQGKIVECGNHSELIKDINGEYARLYQAHTTA
jgi:subfamily B ATP-binding cassette protein MsbA